MSVQRGDRYVLLRVARHLNPPRLNSPPPTPYPTHTKAPPSGGWTARRNTHSGEATFPPGWLQTATWQTQQVVVQYSCREKRERVAARQLHTPTKNRPYANSKTKTQRKPWESSLTPQEPHDERRGTQRPQEKEIPSKAIPEAQTQERECSTAACEGYPQRDTGCAASRRELSSVVIKKQIEQEKTWHFLVEMGRSDQMMREEETSKRMYPSRPSRERVSSGNWPNKLKITIYIILNLKQDRKQLGENVLKEDDRIK